MPALVSIVIAVPISIALLIWSDVGSTQEAMEKRKLDARNFGMPGDYHTLYGETRE